MANDDMDSLTEITHCEVCGNTALEPVLDLGQQPLCDDLVPINAAQMAARQPLQLMFCSQCLTVHQRFQVEKTRLFPNVYHYRSRMTKNVVDGLRDLVAVTEKFLGSLAGKRVLDIGCNDGTLLDIFRQKGAITFGIEPTDAGLEAKANGHDTEIGYFSAALAADYVGKHEKPDIITFTNVFAHIEDLDDVIRGIRTLMHDETVVVIENHYLGAVIEKKQFDTFYHEHPRTYSYRSFEFIARKMGMTIAKVSFPDRYNGNIRIILSRSEQPSPHLVDESAFADDLRALQNHVEHKKTEVLNTLNALVAKHAPLPAKAFPGRAAVIVNYFGIDERLIAATYERSQSPKIGHFVPGTRIPIMDEAVFFQAPPAPVLVNFAWHIKAEIHAYLREHGYRGEIVEVYS